jgi:hypothetical protein
MTLPNDLMPGTIRPEKHRRRTPEEHCHLITWLSCLRRKTDVAFSSSKKGSALAEIPDEIEVLESSATGCYAYLPALEDTAQSVSALVQTWEMREMRRALGSEVIGAQGVAVGVEEGAASWA